MRVPPVSALRGISALPVVLFDFLTSRLPGEGLGERALRRRKNFSDVILDM